MGGLRDLVVELFGFVFCREEGWLVICWLVKERENRIRWREEHYRNFTTPYYSYLVPVWGVGVGQLEETSSRTSICHLSMSEQSDKSK